MYWMWNLEREGHLFALICCFNNFSVLIVVTGTSSLACIQMSPLELLVLYLNCFIENLQWDVKLL